MTVYLVGAGPGDPGLLTARALELIAARRRDRLRPADPRRGARAALAPTPSCSTPARRAAVRRSPRTRSMRCSSSTARAGKSVVRLKGGDPFVFGRGGEEAEALREAGIPFEVVPGVTAGVAAPAYAGIPVTHRDAASAVAFVTGHEDPAKPESALDWRALAALPGDARGLHGRAPAGRDRRAADRRRARRRAAGRGHRARHAPRPAGGHRRRWRALRRAPRSSGIRAPAIAVFGEVAALRERLRWFEAAATGGRQRRGHPGACAGQRARLAAAARSAPRSSRRRRSGSRRWRGRCRTCAAMTWCA